ncbi:hypothetical protein LAWI1_G005372 [Lachnellula willkommii]|uniref:Uncharacterized protein n=1 Tax=Lachnellula willkommii TaxID=215461 RepID=A0A559MDM7_9HELO|nr:hypothetical protein LAWI1_G005372 [Lachnellula willkommii]
MILDWLLQELPQDLLSKLEIYTFGNAANHFNNPHLHLLSQSAALQNPRRFTLTRTRTHIIKHEHNHNHNLANPRGDEDTDVDVNGKDTRKHETNTTPQGKTIHHIEHYAHTSDPVSRWGVLQFITSPPLSATAPRFMGRVFEYAGASASHGGHQFCMHYLDTMFPLLKCEDGGSGVGGSGFEGCADGDAGGNAFMEQDVEWWGGDAGREGLESSSLSAAGRFAGAGEGEGEVGIGVGIDEMSPVSASSTMNALRGELENWRGLKKERYKVRELSRLWLYRNGRSPRKDAVDAGIARMATI